MAITLVTSNRPAGMSAEEWDVRVDLAACYRLVHHYGWADMASTHISAVVPGTNDQFLINRHGVLFDQITASSLVKVDYFANKIDNVDARVQQAGFTIHSAIHMGCPEALFCLHTHTIAGITIACQAEGLLPVSYTSLTVLGEIAYYDGQKLPGEMSERDTMARVLGKKRILVMRNHGILTCGRTAAEAFMATWRFERACLIQLAFQNSGAKLNPMPGEVIEKGTARGQKAFWKDGANDPVYLEWPSLRRMLDKMDPSYQS